jgi:hypothetical protein
VRRSRCALLLSPGGSGGQTRLTQKFNSAGFLRLLIVLALQPPAGDEHDVHTVVGRLRDTARTGLAAQAAIAFGIRPDSKKAEELARVALAYFDGAFVAAQSDDGAELGRLLANLPASLVAVHDRL